MVVNDDAVFLKQRGACRLIARKLRSYRDWRWLGSGLLVTQLTGGGDHVD